MKRLRSLLLMLLMLTCASGCTRSIFATRTVLLLDKNADPVQIARDVKVPVRTYQGMDNNGKPIWKESGTMVIPQGWIASPGPW